MTPHKPPFNLISRPWDPSRSIELEEIYILVDLELRGAYLMAGSCQNTVFLGHLKSCRSRYKLQIGGVVVSLRAIGSGFMPGQGPCYVLTLWTLIDHLLARGTNRKTITITTTVVGFLAGVLKIKIQLGRSLTRRWELRRPSTIC